MRAECAVTADIVVVKGDSDVPQLLLIKRRGQPFEGCWALPGGFLDGTETLEVCAKRELREETGLTVDTVREVGSFSDPERDPRGRVVSIAFWTMIHDSPEIRAGDDAAEARFFSINELPDLAFDHADIVEKARSVMEHCSDD